MTETMNSLATTLFAIGLSMLISSKITEANGSDDPQIGTQPAPLKYDDWAPIHYKAYLSSGHAQAPEVTFELLKQLQNIYKPYNDKETNGRKEKVNNLLQIAEMDPRLCNREYTQELKDLEDRHSPYKKSIIPYIGYHVEQFLNMCEKHVLHNLHENVGAISEEHRANIEAMTNEIAEVKINGVVLGHGNLKKLWIHSDHLIDGILIYMRKKLDTELDPQVYLKAKDGKEKFSTLFKTQVLDMCQAWAEATDPTAALLEFDMYVHFTEDEMKWMRYGQLCHYIDRTKNIVLPKLYRQYKRLTSKYPKIRVAVHRGLRKLNPLNQFHH